MKSVLLFLLFYLLSFPADATLKGAEATRQIMVFRQELNRCLDITSEENQEKKYGQKVEECYRKVGHQIIKTFYSKEKNVSADFNKLIEATNKAYAHMFLLDYCHPNCGSQAIEASYSYINFAIREYLDSLLGVVQAQEKN